MRNKKSSYLFKPSLILACVPKHFGRQVRELIKNNPMISRANNLFILIFSLVFIPVQLLSQDHSCWNIFRGDQALKGVSMFELPEKPGVLWTFQTNDQIMSSPVSCDDKIVFGSGDGFVYCLDISGKLTWKFNTGNNVEAPALILEGTVYIGNLGGTLYSLDLHTGQQNWIYYTDNQISGSPNYWKTDEHTSILVGSYDYFLHCVDASTGKLEWKYESNNFINGAAACQNGVAVFGGCDGFLHMVDINTGSLRDKLAVATYVAGSAALSGNYAYVGDYDGQLTCIDMKDQQISWQWWDETTNLPFIASPSVIEDRIIIGNHNKYVYCFDKSSGELIWKFNTGSRLEASPVVAEQKVLVANMRGDIFILDLNNGKELWSYESGNPVYATPAVIKNRFIVAGTDGYIYCFGEKR